MAQMDLFWIVIGYMLGALMGVMVGLKHALPPKIKRARTCGTCAFCGGISDTSRNGYCTRRPYPANPTYDSGNPNFPTATRTLVELDWPGCGESEERR